MNFIAAATLLASDLASSPDDLGLPNVKVDAGLQSVLNMVFTAAGLLAVIFIIIGGAKYVLSGGDSAGLKSAKETIMYAIVGLVVTLVAFGVVNYITGLS